MKKILLTLAGIVGGLATLVIVGMFIASALGFVYFGVKQPSDFVSVQVQVCSASDIKKYNDLVVTFPTNQEQQTQKIAAFKELATTIVAKNNYKQDPSCVFIVYAAAVQNTNQDDAQKHYDILVALSDLGEYPKNTILDLVSLPSMKDRIESLTNTEEGTPNPLGSG